MSQQPKNPLVRVEMEYADGSVDRLVGLDAQKWLEAADGCVVIADAHSCNYFNGLDLKWENVRKGRAPT